MMHHKIIIKKGSMETPSMNNIYDIRKEKEICSRRKMPGKNNMIRKEYLRG